MSRPRRVAASLLGGVALCASGGVRASESATTGQSAAATAAVGALPKCVSDPVAVDAIEASIAANKTKSPKLYLKYVAYERHFADESDAEKVARLVYAEATAANCGAKTADLMPTIAGVIGNRIRTRGKDARAVVFEPDQFASSLNIYDESHYHEFLCPKDAKLYARALAEARRALAGPTELPPDVVHYFLYKHCPRWTKPPWTMPEYPIAENLRPCLRAFRNPKWH